MAGGKSASHQARQPRFNHWDPYSGRGGWAPERYPHTVPKLHKDMTLFLQINFCLKKKDFLKYCVTNLYKKGIETL